MTAVNKLLNVCLSLQKYKANADLPAPPVEEREDTDTAFNKLRESDESPELETPAPAKVAVKKTSLKKKSVRSSPPLKFRFEKKVNHFTNFIQPFCKEWLRYFNYRSLHE